MAQERRHFPPPEVVAQGYEPGSVNNRGMVIFIILFFAMIAFVQGVSWVLLDHRLRRPRAEDVPPSNVALLETFSAPHLQPSVEHNNMPTIDLENMHAEERHLFEQMGWKVDPGSDVPAIPDDIARQLAQNEATPATTAPATAPATPGGRP